MFLTLAHIRDDGAADRANGVGYLKLARQVLREERNDIEVRCWTHNDTDYYEKRRQLPPSNCGSESNRRTRRKLREAAFAKLGSRCACCGDTDITHFTVHHIENNGNMDRADGLRTIDFLRLIISDKRHDLAAYCPNCQHGAAAPGGCPHRRTR